MRRCELGGSEAWLMSPTLRPSVTARPHSACRVRWQAGSQQLRAARRRRALPGRVRRHFPPCVHRRECGGAHRRRAHGPIPSPTRRRNPIPPPVALTLTDPCPTHSPSLTFSRRRGHGTAEHRLDAPQPGHTDTLAVCMRTMCMHTMCMHTMCMHTM